MDDAVQALTTMYFLFDFTAPVHTEFTYILVYLGCRDGMHAGETHTHTGTDADTQTYTHGPRSTAAGSCLY